MGTSPAKKVWRLVDRFDGEFPDRYFREVMEYIEMKPDHFHAITDRFRSPHLWGKGLQWLLETATSSRREQSQ